jgi:hypothetical protein
MGFWFNKEHRTGFDDAEDLAYAPEGGRVKIWLLGVGLALIPIIYGIHCLITKHATIFGSRGTDLDVHGSGAVSLGIAYISIGVFIHAHWFWGLHQKLESLSYLLKFVTVLVFLGSFGFAIYKAVV